MELKEWSVLFRVNDLCVVRSVRSLVDVCFVCCGFLFNRDVTVTSGASTIMTIWMIFVIVVVLLIFFVCREFLLLRKLDLGQVTCDRILENTHGNWINGIDLMN